MNKDTKLFLEHIEIFMKDVQPILNKNSLNPSSISNICFSRLPSNSVSTEIINCFENSMSVYFRKFNKKSFYSMTSDSFWNNKQSYVSFYKKTNSKKTDYLRPYYLFAISYILDLLRTDASKYKKLLHNSTGLWQYSIILYCQVSVVDISKSTIKKMLLSKDSRVARFAIDKAPISIILSTFKHKEIRNHNFLKRYNKRMKDAGIEPMLLFGENIFSDYSKIYELETLVTKNNSKKILDFYCENKDSVKNTNIWTTERCRSLLRKCIANLSDSDMFLYVDVDIETMFKRKKISSIIKL